MNVSQEESGKRKVNVFDESGQTVEVAEDQEELPAAEAAGDEPDAPEAEVDDTPAEPEKSGRKYKVGDKTFDSADEALDYANSLEAENQIADAYRQGLRDAASQVVSVPQNVTPPEKPAEPDLNTEELYVNPQGFLQKFAAKIKNETHAELDQRDQLKAQSDQIWREFTDRHPMLADFRKEVEDYVEKNQTEVRAIIATKGRQASYDFVATKVKSRFESYANAIRPTRKLSNTSTGTSPSGRSSGVTPKEPPKKALSFSDQIRSLRKRR